MPSSKVFLSVLLILSAGIALQAQETRGTIVGRVVDPTGGVVPNASVHVVNKAMGTTVTLTTNQEGLFTAPLLIPGMYQVTVIASGFKKMVRDNLELRVSDRIEVNSTLEIGASEQSVTVSVDTPLLATETATTGSIVSSQQIMDMPLSYGNPFALIGVSTGTGFMGSPRLDRPFEPTHIANYTVNGTRGDRSDMTLDGAPNTATANAGEVIASYVPPTDLLAEIKVQTANFDAAMGNTEGGVTNLSIKTGTNALHGTGYYGFMRKPTWANDFFNNRIGQERPDFKFDRGGFSAGGPVWIPKLYDGRNKTFFMYGFEWIHDSRPRFDATTPQVPTLDMKKGDFSSLLAAGNQYQIYNPYTRRQVGSRYVEDPFTNNIIPSSLFNNVGKTILDKYYPAPRTTGDAVGSNNFLRPDLAEVTDYWNFTTRIDQNIGTKNRLYSRFSMYDRKGLANPYFDNLATGVLTDFDSYNGVVDDTHILSPTTVLDVRFGYNRYIRHNDGNPDGGFRFDLTQVGLPASYNTLIPEATRRFPRIDLSNYIGTGFTGEYRPVDTASFSTSLNKTMGAHMVRAGFDWRAYRENDVFFSNDQTMRLIFDSSYTRGPQDNSPNSPNSIGQSVAAMLLGLPSNSSLVSRAATYAEQSMTTGFYFQDDWKVTPKLTLNLGLRWEFESPLKERFNRSVAGFNPNYAQPFATAAQAAYAANPAVPGTSIAVKGGLVFSNGDPLYNTPKLNLMPRFGFAYHLLGDTVVRGGFGIYDGFLGERRGDVIQAGYQQSTFINPFAADGVTIATTLSNPFPNGILEPVGSSLGGQTFVGQNISFFNPNPKTPVNYRWQIGFQHQFRRSILVEAEYTGNKAIRIEITRNINALPLQYLSTLPIRDNTQNGYVTAAVTNPFYGLTMPLGTPSSFTSQTISRQQMLLPYPEFGAINTSSNEGFSWYHGLQLRTEKQFSQGLSVIANYTFSKYMVATELLNAADPRPTKMIADQDTPHRVALSSIYQLPFGHGRRWLDKSNGICDRLIGGWEITGIWAFQSGTPLAFGSYSATSATNNGDYFLTASPSGATLPLDQRSPDHWFSTSPFVTASAAQPASHLRVNPYRFSGLRGPRQNNADIGIIKDTRVTETTRMRFSVQAMNVMNHPLFPAPQMSLTSAQFGQIVASTQNNYPRRLQFEMKFIF